MTGWCCGRRTASTGWSPALAVSYAGGTLVPANSRYTGHEVADLVDRTHARLVVVADGFLGRTQIADLRGASDLASVREVIDLADLSAVRADPGDIDDVAAAVVPDDVADILFTSGTTGRPKGAMSAHRQTVGVARAWGELGGVTASDRYLVVNPFFHSFGYKAGIMVGLTTGATLYPVATFDLGATMRLIQDEQITVLPGAPTLYQSLLTAPDRVVVRPVLAAAGGDRRRRRTRRAHRADARARSPRASASTRSSPPSG